MEKKRKNKHSTVIFWICIAVILAYFIVAIIYDWLPVLPYDHPSDDILMPPSSTHWLGTDDLGMDIFSQLLYGTRVSVFLGISCGLISAVGGSMIGMLAGYYGGWVDKVCLSLIDVVNALPDLPFMIVLSALLGPDIKNIVFAICLITWVMPARMARSKVIQIKHQEYVQLSRAYGANFWYIFKNHLLSVVYPIIVVGFIKIVNRAIIAEAGLAFLGLSDPTSKSWGMVLNRVLAFDHIFLTNYWKWWLIAPTLFLVIFVLVISTLAKEAERRM